MGKLGWFDRAREIKLQEWGGGVRLRNCAGKRYTKRERERKRGDDDSGEKEKNRGGGAVDGGEEGGLGHRGGHEGRFSRDLLPAFFCWSLP